MTSAVLVSVFAVLWAIVLTAAGFDFLLGMRSLRPWWTRWFVAFVLWTTAVLMFLAALE